MTNKHDRWKRFKNFYLKHIKNTKIHINKISSSIKNVKITRPQAVCLAFLSAMIIYSMSILNIALEVTIDGDVVGFVKSEEEVKTVIKQVEKRSSQILGRTFTLSPDISYSIKVISDDALINNETLTEYLSNTVDEITTLAVVSVDGQKIGGMSSISDVKSVLSDITNQYINGDESAEVNFLQSVAINVQEAPSELAMTSDQLKSALNSTEAVKKTYTIKGNETFSEIAQSNGMKTAEIMSLNPDVDPLKLREGMEVNLKSDEPVLSVQVVKDIEYTEDIPFETITKENSSLPKNTKKVVQEGYKGSASIVATVKLIDGVEQERTISSRTVMSTAQSKIVEVGTKVVGVGTGDMIKPFYAGRISSNYGYRGREFHTGVDFPGKTGSSVVASDNGKVTFAGWNGNYGYCVIINHGNGLETLYAHNSSLTVKSGDVVEKGQTIAKLGSTGRSTGPHCHFEVKKNGKHVNPWTYIN